MPHVRLPKLQKPYDPIILIQTGNFHERSLHTRQKMIPDIQNGRKTSKLVTALNYVFPGLIISLGFMRPNLRIRGLSVQATEAVFAIAIVILAVAIVKRKICIRFDALMLPLGVYFLALAASALFSSDPEFSLLKLLGEAYLVGLAVITIAVVQDEKMIKRVVHSWIVAASIVGIVGLAAVALFYIDRENPLLALILHHYGSLPPGNYPRIQSTFIYPAMLCNYLTVGVVFLFAAKRLDWIRSKVFYTLLIIQTVAAIFTLTPGLGGFILAISLWLGLNASENLGHLPRKAVIAAGGGVALLSLIVSAFTLRQIPTSPYFFELLGTRIDPTQRLLAWQGALETLVQYPVFGRGLGLGVANVHFLAPSGQNQLLTDAHNIWLSIAGQSGLLALAAVVWLCVAVTRRFLPLTIGNDTKSIVLTACGIAFISIFFVQGLVGSFEDARHLWVLVGLIAAVSAFDENEQLRSNSGEFGSGA